MLWLKFFESVWSCNRLTQIYYVKENLSDNFKVLNVNKMQNYTLFLFTI
ncbi:hypothetical protein SAMN05444380_11731 [Thermophagus xiamenensis]|uniref:Uncharacterized protein n=1 Tax=Thermophagus xiamenensis TaxID=385682 RepID=A0A1I2CWE0_9BACT|nr:hypothetical protein SAMN05444380_11731 [Thermophagus xiamenensis]